MGASRLSQLQDNLGAMDAVDQLTDDVMDKINGLLDNDPVAMDFQ